MWTEDDTFRKLKRTPFADLFPMDDVSIYGEGYNLLDHIESHGWTMAEYAGEYYDRNFPSGSKEWPVRETYIRTAVEGHVRKIKYE